MKASWTPKNVVPDDVLKTGTTEGNMTALCIMCNCISTDNIPAEEAKSSSVFYFSQIAAHAN